MIRSHAKEEPRYESDPDMDGQNYAVRELPVWSTVRKFFGRSQRVLEIVSLQDLAGEENQTPQFDDPA